MEENKNLDKIDEPKKERSPLDDSGLLWDDKPIDEENDELEFSFCKEINTNTLYEFSKYKNKKIYDVGLFHLISGEYWPNIGEILISFDGKKIYNLWSNYPWDFTNEEIAIFKEEDTYWANFFKDREGTEKFEDADRDYPIVID